MAEKTFPPAAERLAQQEPQCGFGQLGICCKLCALGPCRIDPFGEGPRYGVCGADADTIAARNFLRMVAVGASSHSDHGRAVAETIVKVAEGKAPGYAIRDEYKLLKLARELGVETGENRKIEEIALDVGRKCLAEFGRQEGRLFFLDRAPLKRRKIWDELGISPRGIDREAVESLHRTHMGTDQEYHNLMKQASRCALADGWGGSMIATELQDVLFGIPKPIPARVNFGVLKEDTVNIIVHGHEPLLSEMIVVAAESPEMISLASEKGAAGITVAGICCTANEVLMRHGVPIMGNFLNQELALATGAVDVMAVDVQCVMQSLPSVAACYHTKVITTSDKAKIGGAVHVEFTEETALDKAREIVKMAVEGFRRREKANVNIPAEEADLIAGFSFESINYTLGGLFRSSFRPLNDNIIGGRVRGVAGVVGCNNCKVGHDELHVALVKELVRNDVLVLQTGCAAIGCAKAGLLDPVKGLEYCGGGLREVCEAVGIPPVIHMGSCVDNSRILVAATAMVKEGGLGDDLCDLPAAGVAPEWMSEKAVAIGQYFVASGVYTVFGVTFPTLGAKGLTDYLFRGIEAETGGRWGHETDPAKMAEMVIAHIDAKRKALGLDRARERVLYDMAMRRDLE